MKTTDDTEWQLLAPVYANPDDRDALGVLANHYSQRGAWDEYSAVKSRLLLLAPPAASPGPAPGGPFPRIGAPRAQARPGTVLGKWINPTDLPELYGRPEVSPHELSIRLKLTKSPDAATLVRIGDAACADLMFSIGEVYYERALQLDPKEARARHRLDDVKRIRAAR